MNILDKASKILQQPVCDHCLGRQFAQLLSGCTNAERGSLLRTAVAMSIDKSKEEKKEERGAGNAESSAASVAHIDVHNLDMPNFSGFKFHNLDAKAQRRKKCSVCNDFFANMDKWAGKISKAAAKYNFRTFLVGTKLHFDLINAEESLWERVGIDYCEPLKAEINRELGKLVEKKLKVKFDKSNPDVNIIVNIAGNKVDILVNPLFVYGEYQKLKRGIPQTKWPSGKYKTSVEQIIAKPFMHATRAVGHKLHGLGREDIDARCLGWRPFVLELLKPKTRNIKLKSLAKKIAPAVRVRNLRFSSIAEVRRIKDARCDKTYSLVVECDKKVDKQDLRRLLSISIINQKTPQRVLHRRADKFRKRKVKSLSAKSLGPRRFRLIITCEAGLYIKELVTGDNGRTHPSVSEILGARCMAKDLDVLKIHLKNL